MPFFKFRSPAFLHSEDSTSDTAMTDRVARYPWWPEKRCRRWRQGWFTGTWRIYGEPEKSSLLINAVGCPQK